MKDQVMGDEQQNMRFTRFAALHQVCRTDSLAAIMSQLRVGYERAKVFYPNDNPPTLEQTALAVQDGAVPIIFTTATAKV